MASAASTATLVLKLLPLFLHPIADRSTLNILAAWQSAVEPATLAPVDMAATRQRAWDDSCCQRSSSLLLSSAVDDSGSGHGSAPASLPCQALGCRLSRFHPWPADGRRRHQGGGGSGVSALTCASHTHAHAMSSWMPVARTGWPASEVAGALSPPSHSLLNDVGPCGGDALRAQVPSCKEPAGLSRSDGKRPDGVLLIPWSRGRCVTWDVTSSHLPSSATRGLGQRLLEQKLPRVSSIARWQPLTFSCRLLSKRWGPGGLKRLRSLRNWGGG